MSDEKDWDEGPCFRADGGASGHPRLIPLRDGDPNATTPEDIAMDRLVAEIEVTV